MIKIGGLHFPNDEKHFQEHKDRVGEYQVEQRNYAFKFVMNWGVAVDVGANVGIFARHFAKRFRRVVAIEPIPENVECLRRNTPKEVDIRQVAVGDRAGSFTMYRGRKCCADSYVYEHIEVEVPDEPADYKRLRQVRMVTLDGLDLAQCDLLKIDVSGSELIALKGAFKTIQRCRPVVILEEKRLGPSGSTRRIEESKAMLIELGMNANDRIGADRIYSF